MAADCPTSANRPADVTPDDATPGADTAGWQLPPLDDPPGDLGDDCWTKFDELWAGDPAGWPTEQQAWYGAQPPTDSALGQPYVREAFGAGFTHRYGEGIEELTDAAAHDAFAAGGPADTMRPGGPLAGLVAGTWRADLADLTDDELVGLLGAARRLTSWQAAIELTAVSELFSRRLAAARADRMPGPPTGERVSAELAAALVLTGAAADDLLSLATVLERLPQVREALAAGSIDRARASIFAAELAGLDHVDAVAVAAALLPGAGDLTTSQLRRALLRAVLAIDPDAARRRRQQAGRGARVQVWQEASGNAAIAGRELPPATVIAMDKHLTALASALMKAGAPGTIDQIRSRVFAGLLSGQSPDTLLPAGSSGGGQPVSVPAAEPDSRDGSPCWPTGPRGSVHLTLPLDTWLGLADRPGEITGLGPADSDACRDLAAALARQQATRYCLTITDRSGRALGHACARRAPPVIPALGTQPDPRAHYPPQLRSWLADLTITWVTHGDGSCDHRFRTAGYRPSGRLRHLAGIVNPTCSFPGCRRPAAGCDLDHVRPHHLGGVTCLCNLHPACRRHHQCKQAPGWSLIQSTPGTLTWTVPHGRSYVTTAEPYPL